MDGHCQGDRASHGFVYWKEKKDVKNIEGDVRMGALPSELHLGARLEKRKLAKRSDQAPGWGMRRIKGACGRLAS